MGTPAREMWIASASVPVERADAATVNGISSRSAASCSSSNTRGLTTEPRSITGAAAQLVLPELLVLDPGRVGGVGHVDDDRHVRLERERARARAGEGDLLLHGGDGATSPGAPPASATSRAASSAT